MLHIALCDDNPASIEILEKYLVLCQEKVQIKYNQFSLFM